MAIRAGGKQWRSTLPPSSEVQWGERRIVFMRGQERRGDDITECTETEVVVMPLMILCGHI
eukprot:7960316-Prorocentrum_lima.AAC.1